MAKVALKRMKREMQNGLCELSGTPLPEDPTLFDTDRKIPKAQGGIYLVKNSRAVDPIAHQKRHGTYRVRKAELETLKTLVDDRGQLMKLKNKINNQLLAYERKTDHPNPKTVAFLKAQLSPVSAELRNKEKEIKKTLKAMNDPLANAALSVTSIGPMTAAYCLVYIDIAKARHASSLWAYAGLDKPSHSRYKKGAAGGGNKTLRTVLYTMAESQMKNKNAPYRLVYDRVKRRLETSDKMVWTRNTQGKLVECAWKSADTKPSHRHGAALRAVMKHFLADYWFVGRTLMGLDTNPTYAEAILGKDGHRTIMPQERGWKY